MSLYKAYSDTRNLYLLGTASNVNLKNLKYPEKFPNKDGCIYIELSEKESASTYSFILKNRKYLEVEIHVGLCFVIDGTTN